jgi:alcohol dehydrogenase class IV
MISHNWLTYSPNTVIFGLDAVSNTGSQLSSRGIHKVLVVTDQGLLNTGIVDKVIENLKAENISSVIFSDVLPEPSTLSADECAHIVKVEGLNGIVTVGGGSPMDTAKAAAVLYEQGGDFKEYATKAKTIKARTIPTVYIPTTAGTGSEVSIYSVMTCTDNQKRALGSPHLLGDLAIVDPGLTVGLPPHITAATGFDALTHCMQGYLAVNDSVYTDMIALEGIRCINESLRKVVYNGKDMDARIKMSYGSLLGGFCINNIKSGMADHGFSYTYSAKYHLSHGVALATLWPSFLLNIAKSDNRKLIALAEAFGLHVTGVPAWRAGEMAAEALKRLIEDIELPSSLSEVGVKEDEIPEFVQLAMKNAQAHIANTPLNLDERAITNIFRDAL